MSVEGLKNNILSKKMDRREFFKYVGFGFIAIAGVTTIGKLLISQPKPTRQTQSDDASYGGKKEDVA